MLVDELKKAGSLIEAGRLEEAEGQCRHIIRQFPGESEGHRLLAAVAFFRGQWPQTVQHLETCIRLNPGSADAFDNLSVALHRLGRPADAERAARRALELQPGSPSSRTNLAVALQSQGKVADAADLFKEVARLCPKDPTVANNRALALLAAGRADEAEIEARRALAMRPNYAEAYSTLGSVLRVLKRLDEAIASYRQSLTMAPHSVETEANLAITLGERGHLAEAEAVCRRILSIGPALATAANAHGNVLRLRDKHDEAEASYRQAAALCPGNASYINNVGVALLPQGRPSEAEAAFRQSVAINPQYADALYNLGNALKAQGKIDEALAQYRHAISVTPSSAEACHNYLLCAQYATDATPARLAAAHRTWEEQHCQPLRKFWPDFKDRRQRSGYPRIGFVGSDFRDHPVGNFVAPVFDALTAQGAQLTCYSTGVYRDAVRERLGRCATFVDAHGLSEEALAEKIRTDEIDVLFDLAGHTAGNRLRVMARKPAPVQISWLGYVGTTGMSAMDAIIADERTIPPGEEEYYVEKVLRMPNSYFCFEPPVDAPNVEPPPMIKAGHPTFGSFNNPAKITPKVVECWSKLLRKAPDARLILKYWGFDDPATKRHFHALFEENGVGLDRLELLGGLLSRREMMAVYHRVDVALDPFPYTGAYTTCNALWMGVPVVTRRGATFAGRQSDSILSAAGFQELIAQNESAYIETATSLIHDIERLSAMRQSSRAKIIASPLCDSKRFGASFWSLIQQQWNDWRSQES